MDICFDCFSGVSGDMLVGSLLGLGASENYLKECLDSLNLSDYKIKISKFSKNGYEVTDFDVVLKENNHDHDMSYLSGEKAFEEIKVKRNLDAVKRIIDNSKLTFKAKKMAIKIFEIVAKAEAKAHGVSLEEVIFHESGAMDSIIDIVSFAVCLDNLNVNKVYVKNLKEGRGQINTRVGLLSIPTPAVKNILNEFNLKVEKTNLPYELITPTGIACVCAVASSFEGVKNKKIVKVKYGNGKRNYKLPCVLRVEAY